MKESGMKIENTFEPEEEALFKDIIRLYKGNLIHVAVADINNPSRHFWIDGKCLGVLGTRICMLVKGRTEFIELQDIKRIKADTPKEE